MTDTKVWTAWDGFACASPVPAGTYVEVRGWDADQTAEGYAEEFYWGLSKGMESEGNIHLYRVLKEAPKEKGPIVAGQKYRIGIDEVIIVGFDPIEQKWVAACEDWAFGISHLEEDDIAEMVLTEDS